MDNFILEFLTTYYDEITPPAFYRSIFPPGELETKGHQETGKYNAIAVELLPAENQKNVKRFIINDDLTKIQDLLKSDNFIIISPVSYAGRSRNSNNARFIYALAFDMDGITKKDHLVDLFHQFDNEFLPTPTYTIFSGSGLHLYYQFETPIPCFDNIIKQLAVLKKQLTTKIWNRYTTDLYENIQYESLFQGFRLVGGITKDGNRTKAFITGNKVSLEYLNKFVEDKHQVKQYVYKSNLTLEKAKELYPEWYNKRVVNQLPRNTWTVKRDLYDWWIKKLKSGATVGHRYYCIMCLCIYAKKCGISFEELQKDAYKLVDYLDSMSKSEENRFTRQDVLSALEMYNDNYIRFPIDSISSLTAIPIEKNKRNGRKQSAHLKIARFTKQVLIDEGKNVKGGRHAVGHIVAEWQQKNPTGRKIDCIKSTGLSKSAVYKYWKNTGC